MVGHDAVWGVPVSPACGVPHADQLTCSGGLETATLFCPQADRGQRGVTWLPGWPQRAFWPTFEGRVRWENIQSAAVRGWAVHTSGHGSTGLEMGASRPKEQTEIHGA